MMGSNQIKGESKKKPQALKGIKRIWRNNQGLSHVPGLVNDNRRIRQKHTAINATGFLAHRDICPNKKMPNMPPLKTQTGPNEG
ncbi:MAG: hypothetical protein M2R45_02531 [Verrucomicrobia subdivision 3 bacterium]|nr:hypothetical protein [Limisphaerales bacterium]MCS1414261.1 hypothetical protein [Limisphaerales bacterium]